MLGQRYKFEFVGKEPLVFRVAASLLLVNTVLMLTLVFGGKYLFPKQAPQIVSWYSDRSIVIQFILMALMGSIFVIFRKRVRWSK
jgi:hypothetical protein